jgi:hypothetical protein
LEGEIIMARNPEGRFQDRLHERLYELFPGCKIFKMDQHQGIPDLLVLWKDKWAMLECKAWRRAHKQPNQDYWVEHYGEMSFSRFINPENMEEVLDELQQAFGA